MHTLLEDLRFAFRMLRKNRGFTIVTVITLALGVGANSTVFGIVDGIFLRPWPVKDPSQLMVITTNTAKETGFTFSSYPDYLDIRNQVSAFSEVLAHGQRGATVSAKGQGEEVSIDVVSENYFAALGVSAALGRTFSAQASQAEGQAVVVSYSLWQRRFGADPDLPGKTITVDGKGFTVLGITPKEFHGLGAPADLWITPSGWITISPGNRYDFETRGSRWLQLVARLQPNVRLEQARAQLQTVATRLSQSYPATNHGISLHAVTAAEEKRHGLGGGLFLMVMVGLVLLISCANVASLLLTQTDRRRKEIATRLALGADRKRLVAQFLTESFVLASMGGVLGLLLARWTTELLPVLGPFSETLGTIDIRLDFRVFLFTAALSLLTVLLFGLAPGLQSTKLSLVTVFKGEDAYLGHPSARFPLRSALVTVEIALSLVLLVGSGLLLRSLLFSQGINPGFDTHKNVVILDMAPPVFYGYNENTAAALYESIVARLGSVPGIERASYARRLPLTENERGETEDVVNPGMEASPGNNQLSVRYNVVSRGFFRTMGTQILRGRDFNQLDSPASAKVAIINEAMAKRFWPGQDPTGRLLRIGGKDCQIIGVVETGKHVYLHETPEPYLFFPFSQVFSFEVTFFVETAGDPQAAASTLLREAQAVDKNLPVVSVTSLPQYVQSILAEERSTTSLLEGLSVLGMFLAAVGLYGVVAYQVNRRTHEIGIRVALGAHPRDVLRLVLGQGIRFGVIGTAAGFVAAFALARLMSSRLYGVKPTDPLTYACSIGVVVAVTLLASYLPARRATKVDPMVALRHE